MACPTSDPIYFYTKSMPYWGLSNFCPPGFEIDGKYWPTVEHFYQASKFDDPAYMERIRRAQTAKEARALGQSRENALREDWVAVREEIMLRALRRKFASPEAKKLLLSTGDRMLVESSPFDHFWGSGRDGTGENRLGHLLMRVRNELRMTLPRAD